MAIVTVVRRTRADEESGRSDLLASSVVGRAAPLAAAVAVASGAGVAGGILVAAAGVANGQPIAGCIALGASLAGCGLVYAGVAAVAVQLVENARTASVGDVTAAASWLSWPKSAGLGATRPRLRPGQLGRADAVRAGGCGSAGGGQDVAGPPGSGACAVSRQAGPGRKRPTGQPTGTRHSLATRPAHRLGGRIHRLRRDHGQHRGKCRGSTGQQPAIAGRAGQARRCGRVDRHLPGRHRQPRRAGRRRLRDLGCPADELGGIGGSARPGAGRQRRPDQMDVGSPAVRAARPGAGAGRGRSGGRAHPRCTDRRRRRGGWNRPCPRCWFRHLQRW